MESAKKLQTKKERVKVRRKSLAQVNAYQGEMKKNMKLPKIKSRVKQQNEMVINPETLMREDPMAEQDNQGDDILN